MNKKGRISEGLFGGGIGAIIAVVFIIFFYLNISQVAVNQIHLEISNDRIEYIRITESQTSKFQLFSPFQEIPNDFPRGYYNLTIALMDQNYTYNLNKKGFSGDFFLEIPISCVNITIYGPNNISDSQMECKGGIR